MYSLKRKVVSTSLESIAEQRQTRKRKKSARYQPNNQEEYKLDFKIIEQINAEVLDFDEHVNDFRLQAGIQPLPLNKATPDLSKEEILVDNLLQKEIQPLPLNQTSSQFSQEEIEPLLLDTETPALSQKEISLLRLQLDQQKEQVSALNASRDPLSPLKSPANNTPDGLTTKESRKRLFSS